MHRVAVNQAIGHLNRRSRNSTSSLADDYGAVNEKPDAKETAELVALAISRIDPELKVVLQLKEIDGLSYSEIAKIEEIPEGTVGSRLNRARRDLRAQLAALEWGS